VNILSQLQTDGSVTYAPASHFTLTGAMSYEGVQTVGTTAFSGASSAVLSIASVVAIVAGLLSLRRE
jgi:hypothetical protein